MNDGELDLEATDLIVNPTGNAVTVSLHRRFTPEIAQAILTRVLADYGRDGRVKVAPAIAKRTGRPFFVIASDTPDDLRETTDRIAREVLAELPPAEEEEST